MLVLDVTEDQRVARYSKRKAALRERVAGDGEEALTLFAADKLSNARELRRRPPVLALITRIERRRKLAEYMRCLALLRNPVFQVP